MAAPLPAGFAAKLRAAVDPSRVWVGGDAGGGADAAAAIQRCSADASRHPGVAPGAVVRPQSTGETAAVVRLCSEARVPITTRGAGTGLEGAAIPIRGGVVLDTRLLRGIEIFPHEALPCARVGAGVLKEELDEAAEQHGLCFGPDPSANPSVGGMASTSGSGLTTLRYGTTRENVLAVEAVLADGSVVRTRRGAVRKSSSGYELAQLLVGAEGTLGVITELTVRLWPRLSERCGVLCSFPATLDAAQAVIALLRMHLASLTRCEFMNAEQIRANNKLAPKAARLAERPTLMLEFSGNDGAACRRDAEAAEPVLRARGAGSYRFAPDGAAFAALWTVRRACYPAGLRYRGTPGGDRTLVSDVCVPLSKLAHVIDDTERDFRSVGVPCLICSHIADGNFHCLIPFSTAEEEAEAKRAEMRLIDRALAADGTVSGEHGIGLGKTHKMQLEHGEAHIAAQRAIKRALDPHNILNPGKLFPDAPRL